MYKTKFEINNLGNLPAEEMRLSDLFLTLSRALDMGNVQVLDHSRRVAYIALEIAKLLDLTAEDTNELVLAALIHDIGIDSYEIKSKAQNNFNLAEKVAEIHATEGAELTKQLRFLPGISDIILYHHHKWEGNNFNQLKEDKIPLASRIIHLADRIEARISSDDFILTQVDDILGDIKAKAGSWFDPDLVVVFSFLAEKESFWLNLTSREYNNILSLWGKGTKTKINLSDLEAVASVVAHLIDRVSPFTSRHSTGVAAMAAMVANELNYNIQEQRSIRIAGLFHDLGKLIVPNDIIEKNGELDNDEYKIVKQHPFYTYRLLSKIKGLGSIPEWAAFHHERLDGTGYPFRINTDNLNRGSRIMAVSDVFQALTEDRPYRKAFSISKSLEIIAEMEADDKLDPEIISVLKNAI